MSISTISKLQRKAARVAGLSYLITFAILVYVNFGIHDPLIVENNAEETARNILAHEQLFRIGIAGDLIYCAGVVVLLTALYIILKPVNWGLALLAAFWKFVWVLIWLVMTLNLFDALQLLGAADYLRAFEVEQLQALARLHLATSLDYYYKKYYVHPIIVKLYEENKLDKYINQLDVIEGDDNKSGLTTEEKILMKILEHA